MIWALVILGVAVVLAGALVVSRHRQPARHAGYEVGVESFRRHMDALSPEARRGVIDRVQAARNRGVPGEE